MFSALDEVTLQYQPLLRRDRSVRGMQVLLRWHHHARGPGSPDAFMPVFEGSALAVPLGEWTLREACIQAARWSSPLMLVVNLAARQLARNAAEPVRAALLGSALPMGRLEVTVTESWLLREPDEARRIVGELSATGALVTLAEFSGWTASVAATRDLAINRIRLASGVVQRIEDSASARSLVHLAGELSRSLGLALDADGVETATQRAFLEDAGCDSMQGPLMGGPAALSVYADMISAERAAPLRTSNASDGRPHRLAAVGGHA